MSEPNGYFETQDHEFKDNTIDAGKFSFTKKPILSKQDSHSSQIAIIHNYPPQQYDQVDHDSDHHKFYSKYKGILKDKDDPPDEIIDDLNFEFNYDEKIRAPRMSLVNVFKENSHNNKSPEDTKGSAISQELQQQQQQQQHSTTSQQSQRTSKQGSITSLQTNKSKTSFSTLDSLDENESKEFATEYKPASYDLTKPTRKYSVDSGTSPTNLKFLRNQYQFQLQQQQRQQLTQQLSQQDIESQSNFDNKEENDSSTAQRSIISKRTSYDNLDPREKGVGGLPVLKQINEPAKLPDYIPPVLRPTNDCNQNYNNNKLQNKKTSVVSNASTNYTRYSSVVTTTSSTQTTPPASELDEPTLNKKKPASSSTISSDNTVDEFFAKLSINNNTESTITNDHTSGIVSPVRSNNGLEVVTSNSSSINKRSGISMKSSGVEPSHSHWKPNSSASQCHACGVKFNMIKRKHHCRHCGLIFCYSCLSNKANLNLLAKFEKPKITYHHHNHHHHNLIQQQQQQQLDQIIVSNSNSISTSQKSDGSQQLEPIMSNSTTHSTSTQSSGTYCKLSKVCPTCYQDYLMFLQNGYEYEVGDNEFGDLGYNKGGDQNNNDRRRSSVGLGRDRLGSEGGSGKIGVIVPNDWTWSSF
ncbi:hypothetical protein CANARDRAFT_29266 [[Candida] arabinofermentans NRRL YB-2248]|uniref:FYVE-type domain-containing protein n=1 Tax=[Candida] arabinofermentans NRRL YB-2248 TaxID=983967 RepID=A0A1E4SY54_9ASCO|nr:hypothetical protein CANARDRAFT_29266 [[Candida] arabinofermentans NRRL YB-2248]